MEITQEAKIALWGSIEKWQKIVEAFRIAERDGSYPDYEEEGIADCPLCQKFNLVGQGTSCAGCPIAEDKGRGGCRGTPYDEWSAEDADGYTGDGETKENAEAMLRYLVDLNSRCEVES